MIEVITPIAAAIICLIILPCLGYLFSLIRDTVGRADLSGVEKAAAEAIQRHSESDDRCFAEIRTKLDNLSNKIDEQYRSLVSLYLAGRNGNVSNKV